MEVGVEIRKPSRPSYPTCGLLGIRGWRESGTVYSEEEKVLEDNSETPSRLENFDKIDLGVEVIGSWSEFEKKFYEASR
ncbi:MAG: hypothetical protein QXN20_05125 [Candidatus Bathyarchaeia archaeon]